MGPVIGVETQDLDEMGLRVDERQIGPPIAVQIARDDVGEIRLREFRLERAKFVERRQRLAGVKYRESASANQQQILAAVAVEIGHAEPLVRERPELAFLPRTENLPLFSQHADFADS